MRIGKRMKIMLATFPCVGISMQTKSYEGHYIERLEYRAWMKSEYHNCLKSTFSVINVFHKKTKHSMQKFWIHSQVQNFFGLSSRFGISVVLREVGIDLNSKHYYIPCGDNEYYQQVVF